MPEPSDLGRDPGDAGRLAEQTLRDLFGLTPAEIRIALAVFEGDSPSDMADRFGVSLSTVKVQLARLFDKLSERASFKESLPQ